MRILKHKEPELLFLGQIHPRVIVITPKQVTVTVTSIPDLHVLTILMEELNDQN